MELFDYDITAIKISKYETNHLHMYVDGNIEFPNVQNMSNESYATFIHEYVHYIQHLTTLFGVRICDMNQRMHLLYLDYLVKHKEIPVPLRLWETDDNLKMFRDSFRRVAGERSCSHNIDAVFLDQIDISEASENKSAVNIGIYDFNNNKIIERGFKFGYYCIIESMAHAIQSIINSDLHHDTVPYRTAELILKEIAPDYANDPKMIASICMCSLHFDNPGAGFFKVLDIQNEHKYSNGLELYQHFVRDYSVVFKNKETPYYGLMEIFLEELKMNLERTVGTELEYYNRVLDACKIEAGFATSKLLEVLYEGDITDKTRFMKELANYYGFPLIDAKNYSALPLKTEKGGKQHPYKEVACINGIELLISRLIERNQSRECRRWITCSMNIYSDPVNCKASEYCTNEPWKNPNDCVFTMALRYYGLNDKKFVIK